MSIFVYRLETSNVTKIQLPGTLPNLFNLMIKSEVSFPISRAYGHSGILVRYSESSSSVSNAIDLLCAR